MITDYAIRDIERIMKDESIPDAKVWEAWSHYADGIVEILRKTDIRNPGFGALARELKYINELALHFRPILYRAQKAFGLKLRK